MNGKLEGKSILVAGAGGIGNALAARYASEGSKVVVGGRCQTNVAGFAVAC